MQFKLIRAITGSVKTGENEMKIYTQEDYNTFEIINDIKQCPSGDYRNFNNFAELCSFAEGCSYNSITMKNTKVVSVFGVGDSKSIYRWLSVNDVNYYQVGCFFGNEQELGEKVKNKYGENHIYFDAIDFINKIPCN